MKYTAILCTKWVRWGLKVLAVVAFIWGVILAVGVGYLSYQPLSLKPFFPLIERTVLDKNVVLEADDILLSYHKRLRLTVENLMVRGQEGEQQTVLARVNHAEIDFANRQLVIGNLRPKHVRVEGVVAHINRTETAVNVGGVTVWRDMAGAARESAVMPQVDVVGTLVDGENLAMLSHLRSLRLADLYVLVRDQPRGVTWLVEDGQATTTRYPDDGPELTVRATLRQREQPLLEAMPVTVKMQPHENDGLTVTLGVAQSDTDLIRPYLPERLQDAVQALGTLGVEVRLGRGNRVAPPSFYADLQDVVIDLPALYSQPLEFQTLYGRGRFDAEADTLTLLALRSIDTEGIMTQVSGTVLQAQTAPMLDLNLESNIQTLAQLKRYLPDQVLPKLFEFFDQHLQQGEMENVRVKFTGDPAIMPHCGEACGLEVWADITDADMRFTPDLTHATQVQGQMYIGQNKLEVTAGRGRYMENDLREVTVRLAPLFEPTTVQKFVTVTGQATGALAPLVGDLTREVPDLAGIPTSIAQHESEMRLVVPVMPRGQTADIADITLTLQSTLRDLRTRLDDTMTFRAPVATLTLADHVAVLEARGTLTTEAFAAPLPMGATLKWQQPLLQAHAGQGEVWLTLAGDALTTAMGQPEMIRVMESLPVSLKLQQIGATVFDVQVTSDAERAGLELGGLGFRKHAGDPLDLTLRGRLDTGREALSVDMLTLTGNDVEVAGSAEILGGEIQRLNLSPVKLGPQDAQQVVVEPGRLTLMGNLLDLRGLDVFGGEQTPLPDDYVLSINLQRLQMNDDGFLSNVTAAARRQGGVWQTMDARGNVNWDGLQPFAMSLQPAENGMRRLTATATDTGKLLQALDVYPNLRGGNLQGEMLLDENNQGTGTFVVREARFVNFPILAQILSLLSLEPLLDPESGVRFEAMTFPIVLEDHVLRLNQADLRGDSMDIALNGFVTLPEEGVNEVNIDGRLVPGLAMNRTIARIPLVGNLLSGSQDGVIVADFKVKGPAAEPDVSVKPLSVLTPGLVKDIFGGLFGGGRTEE